MYSKPTPTIARLGQEGVAQTFLASLGRSAHRLEIGAEWRPILADALDRHREVKAWRPSATAPAENMTALVGPGVVAAAVRTLAQEVATREIEPDHAVAILRSTAAANAEKAPESELRRQAMSASLRLAWDVVATRAESIVAELGDLVADAVNEAKTLAPLVEDIDDDRQAARAGSDVATAWARLGVLAHQVTAAQETARELRTHVLAEWDHAGYGLAAWNYRSPNAHRARSSRNVFGTLTPLHPVQRLVNSLPSTPCVATLDELEPAPTAA